MRLPAMLVTACVSRCNRSPMSRRSSGRSCRPCAPSSTSSRRRQSTRRLQSPQRVRRSHASRLDAPHARAQRSSVRRRGARRIGLALAGGGPLGGIYEVGALLALADSIGHLDFNALDIYVGVSSGSFVAAALANGISPSQMYRLFIEDGPDAALKPQLFLKPAFAEFARRLSGIPSLALRAALQYARDPLRHGAMESIATLARATPTGLF